MRIYKKHYSRKSEVSSTQIASGEIGVSRRGFLTAIPKWTRNSISGKRELVAPTAPVCGGECLVITASLAKRPLGHFIIIYKERDREVKSKNRKN